MFYEIVPPKIFITIAIITSFSLFTMTFKYMLQKKHPIMFPIILILLAIGSIITGLKKYIEVYSLDLRKYLPTIDLFLYGTFGLLMVLVFIYAYMYGNEESKIVGVIALILLIALIILVFLLKFFVN